MVAGELRPYYIRDLLAEAVGTSTEGSSLKQRLVSGLSLLA